MSLLIKGMRIPKPGNYEAIISVDEKRNITLYVKASFPLRALYPYDVVEVPAPHGRLIDADAHIQSLKDNQCGERCRKNHDCVNCGIGMYIRIVENEPTVIEAEE